jgi:hypothetical protein
LNKFMATTTRRPGVAGTSCMVTPGNMTMTRVPGRGG